MSKKPVDRLAVEAVLRDFQDPETGRGVLDMEQVRDLSIADTRVSLQLGLTSYVRPLWNETKADLIERLKNETGAEEVDVDLYEFDRKPQQIGQIGLTAKSVIAVASGKGGVGKSTIAACLALGLLRSGCKVGLMDADVYGPSVPHLLGLQGRLEVLDNKIQPAVTNGLKVVSIGLMVPPGEAVIWRGPMLHGAVTNFLRDTAWGDLDYLIIDMPPGTGDIALTLSQLLPLSGAVIVCTPQDVALIDAVKAIAMYRKVNIPILGVVENMSYFLCPDNGKRYNIFGTGGARQAATDQQLPFLGEVPINMQIRINGDEGKTSANFDDAAIAEHFDPICYSVVKNLATKHRAEPPLPSLTILD